MVRKAECCCGACVIKVDTDPALYGVCNCDNCKKRTGSAFGLSSYFQESSFSIISSHTSLYELESESGMQQRHFCSKCGTTLYWYAEPFKGFVGVAGGCFTEVPLLEPDFSTMNDHKYDWVCFSDTMKKTFSADDIPQV